MHGVGAASSVAVGGDESNANIDGRNGLNGNGANHGKPKPIEPVLLLFSANHAHSLKRVEENYEAYLSKHSDTIAIRDLAYTLAHHREYLAIRSYSVYNNQGLLTENISQPVKTHQPPLPTFVFTGQGAQYERMGAELLTSDTQFLRDIQEMDNILAGLPHAPTWKLESTCNHFPHSLRARDSC